MEGGDEEVVYEIMFDLPDAGLLPVIPNDNDPDERLGDERDDTLVASVPGADDETEAVGRRYPTQARRSVIGNEPYDAYAPRTTFLQLGPVQAHRSVVEASDNLMRMGKEE